MKKLILSLAIIAVAALSANAQQTKSISVQVGGNLASVTQSNLFPSTVSLKSKFGFLVGVVGEMPISGAIAFRPELNFIQKGLKASSGGSTATMSTSYVELPLNVVYNIDAGSSTAFFGAGPNIGFGLGGKLKETGSPDTKIKFDGKKDADVTDDNTHLKALDFGISIIGGYKFTESFFATVGYTIGLSNIDPNPNQSLKNNGFAIKVGYTLNGVKRRK